MLVRPSLAPYVSEEDDARLDPSDILALTTMDSVSIEPTSETTTNTLVAFLDILGTSELVNRGHFGRATAYDFVNPPGVAARKLPAVRFAAFSDSVLITADANDVVDFLTALAFVHRQWFSDGIAVRGGIALGEMDWAHEPAMDRLFAGMPNFLYARVYGRAMVEARRWSRTASPIRIRGDTTERLFGILTSCMRGAKRSQ